MAGYVRPTTRRFTDPFNEKVRERIFSFSSSASSSGSEHDADDNDAVSVSPSPCLSHLVQNFLEETGDDGQNDAVKLDDHHDDDDGDEDEEEGVSCSPFSSDPTDLIIPEVIDRVRNNSDLFHRDLLCHVSRAVDSLSHFRRNQATFNRSVMGYLREVGYDAAVCKTKWDGSPGGSLTTGSYEFIDVIIRSPPPSSSAGDVGAAGGRYIVDVDFAGPFEIARKTERYSMVLGSLPRVFVGIGEDLRRLVRVMADEMRRSMKSSGMTLPPWRKNRYLQAKWFGPYRRTTNQVPLVNAAPPSFAAAKCRAAGFFSAVGDGGIAGMVVAPAVTRTR